MAREMTEEEIATIYRDSKSKRQQIDILAELNACPKAEIIEVLEAKGYEIPDYLKPTPKNPKKTLEDARQQAKEKEESRLLKNEESKKKRPGRPRKTIKTDIEATGEELPKMPRYMIPLTVWATVTERVEELKSEKKREEIKLEGIVREIEELESFLKG